MTHEELKALDGQYVMGTYGRFDVDIDRGKGATLYDLAGKEYIDFSSGIGVCSVGYGDPRWVEAVSGQAAKLAHVSNLFYTALRPIGAGAVPALGHGGGFFCKLWGGGQRGPYQAGSKIQF